MRFSLCVLLLYSIAAFGVTLPEAVDSALKHYPSIRASQQQTAAAIAAIQLARTAYLPRADVLAQLNRATRNNVFGLLLPQSTLPTISGPPKPENDMSQRLGQRGWLPGFLGTFRLRPAAGEHRSGRSGSHASKRSSGAHAVGCSLARSPTHI